MHNFLIGFGFGLFLLFQWDSGDWSRGRDRGDRAARTPTTQSDETNLTTMDGGTGFPPRP